MSSSFNHLIEKITDQIWGSAATDKILREMIVETIFKKYKKPFSPEEIREILADKRYSIRDSKGNILIPAKTIRDIKVFDKKHKKFLVSKDIQENVVVLDSSDMYVDDMAVKMCLFDEIIIMVNFRSIKTFHENDNLTIDDLVKHYSAICRTYKSICAEMFMLEELKNDKEVSVIFSQSVNRKLKMKLIPFDYDNELIVPQYEENIYKINDNNKYIIDFVVVKNSKN